MDKVYCGKCKHLPWRGASACYHPDNTIWGNHESPDSVRCKLLAREKNRNNDCPDFEPWPERILPEKLPWYKRIFKKG